MTERKKAPRGAGTFPPQLGAGGNPSSAIAQGFSMALFAAAQNDDKRAGDILRKVLREMQDQYLQGGE